MKQRTWLPIFFGGVLVVVGLLAVAERLLPRRYFLLVLFGGAILLTILEALLSQRKPRNGNTEQSSLTNSSGSSVNPREQEVTRRFDGGEVLRFVPTTKWLLLLSVGLALLAILVTRALIFVSPDEHLTYAYIGGLVGLGLAMVAVLLESEHRPVDGVKWFPLVLGLVVIGLAVKLIHLVFSELEGEGLAEGICITSVAATVPIVLRHRLFRSLVPNTGVKPGRATKRA